MNEAVERYFAELPRERRAVVQRLHALVLELYPHAEVDFSYSMPTYRVDEGWVSLANQKRYVSLYTCGEQHLAEFRKRHPRIKTGKGCINLKPDAELPEAALRQVIRHAIDHPK